MPLGISLVSAYLLLVPLITLGPWTGASPHDVARVAQVALLAACSGVLVRFITNSGKLWLSPQALAILGLAIVSSLLASSPWHAARDLAVAAGLAGVAIAVAVGSRTFAMQEAIATVMLAATAMYSLILLAVFGLAAASSQSVYLDEIFVGYANYRFYNHVQTVALPLVAGASVIVQRPWLRWVAWCTLIIGFSLVILASARGTSLGLILGCAIALVCLQRNGVRLVRRMVIGAVAGAALYFVLFRWPLMLLDVHAVAGRQFGETGTGYARLFLWRLAVDDILEAPWLGIGPMHFAHSDRANIKAAHPHNIYLQVAAEYGLPMLILLSITCVTGLACVRRAVRGCTDARHTTWGAALFTACVAALGDGLVSGNFVMPVSQVWIAATVGCAISFTWIAQPNRGGGSETRQRPRAWRHAIAIALVASQAWLFTTTAREAMGLSLLMQQQRARVANWGFNPRFWSHGWF